MQSNGSAVIQFYLNT